MRLFLRHLTFGLLFALCAVASAQPEDAQVRREIEQVYAKWDRLVAQRNVKGLIAMFDPSFTATDKNGRVTHFAQAVRMFEGLFQTFRDPKSRIRVDQIQRQGDEVVAWVSMAMSFKAREGTRWKPQSMTVKFAETLKKTPSGWRFLASQELL